MCIEPLGLSRVKNNYTCITSHSTPQQVTNEDRKFLEVNDKIAQVHKIVRAIILSHANLFMFHTTLIIYYHKNIVKT
jgi:two-component sensor histidine kinase